MAMEKSGKKTAEIKVRCTLEFKGWVQEMARQKNKTISDMVVIGWEKFDKNYVAETKPRKIIHQADPALIRKISKIGNNLNQIARKINTDSTVEAVEILSNLEVIRILENHKMP